MKKQIELTKKTIIILSSIFGVSVVGLGLGLGHFAYKASHNVSSVVVTFDTNGGSTVKPITLLSGEKLDRSKIYTTKGNDFTFVGWYIDQELTKPFSFEEKINSSMTLYAKWDLHETKDGLIYTLNSSSSGYLVSGVIDLGALPDNVKIPATYEGLPITGINPNGFAGTYIKSIELPNSVIEIDENAFSNCQILSSIVLSNNLSYIGDNAFENCYSLSEIKFPNSLNYIGNAAFKNCHNLINVSLPENFEILEENVFYNCQQLKNVNLGKHISDLKAGTFSNCVSLNEITFPCSLTDIANNVFNGSGLSRINLEDDASKWKKLSDNTEIAVEELAEKLKTDGIAIFKSAFYSDSSNGLVYYKKGKNIEGNDIIGVGYSDELKTLKSDTIVIPEKINVGGVEYIVNEITKGAFDKTEHTFIDGLKTITIPSSIKTIKRNAFKNCSGLTTVTFDESSNESKLQTIDNEAFYGCSSLNSITLPKSLLGLGDNSFSYTGLTSINIPENVSAINYGTKGLSKTNLFPFAYVDSLTSITVDTSNLYFGSADNGFYEKNQNQLDKLVFLPFGLTGSFTVNLAATKISHTALQGSKISSFEISKSIAYDSTIYQCFLDISDTLKLEKLTAITVNSSNENYYSDGIALFDKNQTQVIKYPTYSASTSYTIPSTVTTIGDYCFYKNSYLTSVLDESNNIETIGHHAFDNCTSLTQIFNTYNKIYRADEIAISIGQFAFNETKLSTLYIGSSISCNDYCFNIPSLKTVTIDDSATANLTEIVEEGESGKTCIYDHADVVFVKNNISLDESSYLSKNFTKQASPSKEGYSEYR